MDDRADELPGPRLAGPLLSLMGEVGELKRVRSAGRVGSIAERLFADGWARLLAGCPLGAAMGAHVGRTLACVRLGDIDEAVLRDLGVEAATAREVMDGGLRAVVGAVDGALLASLVAAGPAPAASLPGFVAALASQPRAGVTCPGRPRLVFEPVENHAEHCAVVAVYGAMLAPVFGAAPEVVWLASMAHHFHNAFLPDAGFTGEMLLGGHLEGMIGRAVTRCLAMLPDGLAGQVEAALPVLRDASTPEGRAFHAADTLDRVWQIEQHLRPGRIGLDYVLREMALVHEGPAKRFQDAVLRAAGLPA